jgi:hypothetical protein
MVSFVTSSEKLIHTMNQLFADIFNNWQNSSNLDRDINHLWKRYKAVAMISLRAGYTRMPA